MSLRKLVTLAVILEFLLIATTANAQVVLPSGKTLGERLDEFGRNIFGGILSEDEENAQTKDKRQNKDNAQNSKQATRTPIRKYDQVEIPEDGSFTRSGSILRPSSSNQQTMTKGSAARSSGSYQTDTYTSSDYASSPQTSTSNARPGRRHFDETYSEDDADTPDTTPISPATPAKQPIVVTPSKNLGGSQELSDKSNLTSVPLYERLEQFRKSAFDNAARGTTVKSSQGGAISSGELPSIGPSPSASEDATAGRSAPKKPADRSSANSESLPQAAENTTAANTTGRPTLAKRPASETTSAQSMVAERTSPTTRMDSKVASPDLAPSTPHTAKEINPFSHKSETPAANENNVLFARKTPVISVETHGPRKIIVGKESSYELKIINSGEVPAEELIVFVDLPQWAEVVGAEASTGTTQVGAAGQISAPFQWKAGTLAGKSQEKLTLRLVPRQSRPFDLAVRWEFKPAASQTMIEVQEPKLEMQLEGPREVNYGKKEIYRLKVLNSGTGHAEGVVIKLVPVGTGENVPAVYQLGLLGAGEEKDIEVELTARQSGTLEIQVDAQGDAGNSVHLSEKVLVRRGGLEIDVDGPKLQFVGATAIYSLRLRNTGNAPAKNITFTSALPPGLKYVGGIEGARPENNNKLHWTVESINPEAVQNFTIKCIAGTAGVNRVEIAATADDDLTASTVAVTQVEAVANLLLNVQDPGGPVPVGEESTYEIHVRNRGTKDAEGIEVIGYFSRGIEPTSAEGGANRLGPGQVVFTTIPSLAPGAELVLKIHARAETPGNHVFRAEVHCKAMGSRLVSEDTTLYYQDAPAIPQNSQARPYTRGVR